MNCVDQNLGRFLSHLEGRLIHRRHRRIHKARDLVVGKPYDGDVARDSQSRLLDLLERTNGNRIVHRKHRVRLHILVQHALHQPVSVLLMQSAVAEKAVRRCQAALSQGLFVAVLAPDADAELPGTPEVSDALVSSLCQVHHRLVRALRVIDNDLGRIDVFARTIKEHKGDFPPQEVLKMLPRLCVLRNRYNNAGNPVVHHGIRVYDFSFIALVRLAEDNRVARIIGNLFDAADR